MRRLLLVISVVTAFVLGGTGSAIAAPLPDRHRTPGDSSEAVSQANIATTICRVGYTRTVRNVSSRQRAIVFAKYHVKQKDRSKYVIDHLIPLELGGSNAVANLWPELKKGDRRGSTKDTVENKLHTLVCAGQVQLADAQRAIARRWTTALVVAAPTTTTTTTTLPPPTEPPTTAAPAPPPPQAAPEPPPPAPASNCDPNYTPCIPPYPPDLDCADTGPVTVIGSDPHGLDADGDGAGCE